MHFAFSVSAKKAMSVCGCAHFENGLYKRSPVCVRAVEYVDKVSPFMQESWATTGTQVQLLFSI